MISSSSSLSRFVTLAALVASMAGCALPPKALVIPPNGTTWRITGIDVEIFKTGVDAAPVSASKASPDAYVPEEKLIERIVPKLVAAGIPARAKLVATLPGDPVPSADQVFGASPANAVLVLTKLKADTTCTVSVCGTSTWYRASLQDRHTGAEQWAELFHLGSNNKGLDGNMRSMDATLAQIITQLQKVVVVKS
jgi:hypothetical protein